VLIQQSDQYVESQFTSWKSLVHTEFEVANPFLYKKAEIVLSANCLHSYQDSLVLRKTFPSGLLASTLFTAVS